MSSKFKLVSGIIFGDGTLIPAGKVVELDEKDEATQGYLERGTIKPYVEGEEEVQVEQPQESAEAPVNDVPVPPAETPEPTAEQLQRDFQQAGVEGSPNVPQPN